MISILLTAILVVLPCSAQQVEGAATMDIKEFFNKFSKDNIDLADQFYDQNIEFHDPLVTVRGLPAMKDYYRKMYKNVQSIRFEFSDVVTSGDRQVAVWTMHLKAKGLNGGEEVVLPGTSHIVYKDGKAIYHRDYFDMGAFIYEHVPILGGIIRKIKAMLHD